MHVFLLLLLALCACGKAVSSPAQSLHGADAKLAFVDWRKNLDTDWGYPIDFRFELSSEYGSDDSSYEGFSGQAEFAADVSVRESWLFDVVFDLQFIGRDEDKVNAHLQLACDQDQLRADFPSLRELAGKRAGNRARPSAISISTDRLELAFGVILQQLFDAGEDPDIREVLNQYFVFDDLYLTQGLGDIFHPRVGLNGLTTSPFVVHGWHDSGEKITLDLGFDLEAMLGMDAEMQRMQKKDPQGFESMQRFAEDFSFKASFRKEDGYPLAAAGEYAMDEDCETHGSHPVHFSFKMEYLPLSRPIPGFEFSDPDEVQDLNEMFDSFWPMVRASMPEVFRAMATKVEEKEAEEDFSF